MACSRFSVEYKPFDSDSKVHHPDSTMHSYIIFIDCGFSSLCGIADKSSVASALPLAVKVAHYESGWEYSNSWQNFCLVIIVILKCFYGALIIATYNCVLRPTFDQSHGNRM